MNKFFVFFTKNQSFIYKVFLYLISTVLVIYLLPKGGKFKDFQKGKLWQHENLYAPFDFTIKKDKATLALETEAVRSNAIPYFDIDPRGKTEAIQNYNTLFDNSFVDSLYRTRRRAAKNFGLNILNAVYDVGVIDEIHSFDKDQLVYLKNGNEVSEVLYAQVISKRDLSGIIKQRSRTTATEDILNLMEQLLQRTVQGNVTYNAQYTEDLLESAIQDINPNQGVIEKGTRIIGKGEVVEGNTYRILNSLEARYESAIWSQSNYYWVVFGYAMLVSLVFIMLFLFLRKYRNEIYEDNTKVSFIFFNVILMVFLTTLVVKYDATYVYCNPIVYSTHHSEEFFRRKTGTFRACAYPITTGIHRAQ